MYNKDNTCKRWTSCMRCKRHPVVQRTPSEDNMGSRVEDALVMWVPNILRMRPISPIWKVPRIKCKTENDRPRLMSYGCRIASVWYARHAAPHNKWTPRPPIGISNDLCVELTMSSGCGKIPRGYTINMERLELATEGGLTFGRETTSKDLAMCPSIAVAMQLQ